MLRRTVAKASPESPVRADRLVGYPQKTNFSVARVSVAGVFLSLLFAASTFGDEGHSQPVSKVAVRMTKRNEGGLIRFFVENLERVGVTATFEPGLVNMRSSTAFPCTVALPPGSITEVFCLAKR